MPSTPYEPLKGRRTFPLLSCLGSPDFRLPGDVKHVAASTDGSMALGLTSGGFLAAWELKSGQELGALTPERSSEARCAAFSGAQVVLLSRGGAVRRWDPKKDKLDDLFECGAPTGHAAFSPDARLLALKTAAGLELWDLTKRRQLQVWPKAEGLSAFSISPDGKGVLATTQESTLCLFDAAEGTRLDVDPKIEAILGAVLVSARRAAVVSATGVALVDLAPKLKVTLLQRGSWDSHPGSVAVAAGGNHLIAGFNVGAVHVFNLKTRKLTARCAHTDDSRTELRSRNAFGAAERVDAVALCADGTLAVSGARKTMRFFRTAKCEELRFSAAHKARISGVALAGATALSSSPDGLLVVQERRSGKLLRSLAMPGPINALAGSADGGSTAWIGLDGAVEAWDATTGKRRASVSVERQSGVADRVQSLALCEDGATLLSGSMHGYVEARDAKSGKVLRQFKGPGSPIEGLAASGEWVLAGDSKGRLHLLDLASLSELATVTAHKDAVASVALSAGARRAASATAHEVTLWEMDAHQEKLRLVAIQVMKQEDPYVARPVRFSRDGSVLFVGGRSVVALDAATGRELDSADLRPARDAASALLVPPDGASLWVGTGRGVVLQLGLEGMKAPAPRAVEPPAAKVVPKGPFAPIATLTGDALREGLRHHFSPWAATKPCQAILEALVERVESCETNERGDLVVTFKADRQARYSVTFGQAYTGKAAPGTPLPPKSFWDVVRMHNGVRFGDGIPEELDLSGYDEEEGVLCDLPLEELSGSVARQLGFCDAGKSWFFFDLKKKNKLGEPLICLADPGEKLASAQPFPEQDKVPFGTGGFLLRVLAHRVLAKDKSFAGLGGDCGGGRSGREVRAARQRRGGPPTRRWAPGAVGKRFPTARTIRAAVVTDRTTRSAVQALSAARSLPPRKTAGVAMDRASTPERRWRTRGTPR
ncbi:MAG: WD40 repeat domain-containing protein [Deltaproteobacteria bacterium]|nr:WD40 repeat domain-containing protein [Deltaproteobacteria bacterium]